MITGRGALKNKEEMNNEKIQIYICFGCSYRYDDSIRQVKNRLMNSGINMI